MKKKVVSLGSILNGPKAKLKSFFAPGEHGKVRFQAIFVILAFFALLVYSFPFIWNNGVDLAKKQFNIEIPKLRDTGFHFGLDLLGGTHLVYEADTQGITYKEQGDAIEGVRDVIERRVNVLGVSEPLVQTNYSGDKWRVIVELAGVKEVGDAIKQIGETPILQFKEQSETPTRELTSEEQQQIIDANTDAKTRADEALKRVLKEEDFGDLAFQLSEDTGSQEKKGELDWFSEGAMIPEFEQAVKNLKDNQIRLTLLETDYGYHIIKRLGEREIVENDQTIKQYNAQHILIRTKTARDFLTANDFWLDTKLSGKQLQRASVQFDPNTNIPEIGLEFNSEGKDLFKQITERNVGAPVGIFLDGQLITAPRVNDVIYDGNARITGTYTFEEAKLLARRLNAGALPVPIKLVSQQTVGASLGKISVDKSLYAGMIGFIFVIIFMILYYRLAGLMSVLALGFYGILLIALFKFVPVTISLAGIAGFILSIGMAVDANVLIFERLKEELADGKDLSYASDEAFRRAWPSIRDGNLSTLITTLILFWFSTSLIKGFALTLSLGILVSIFTAMVILKIFLKFAIGIIKKNWWYGK